MPTRQDPAQRATLNVKFDAPSRLKLAASGSRLARTQLESGRELHTFALGQPSPPFLFAFAAGQIDEAELAVDDVKLRALGAPGADLVGALAITAPMYRFLRERLGMALPAKEYVQVFVQGDAAQEAAGMALLSDEALKNVVKDPTDDWIFSHELAHQWFGWLIPCADFADFWLNEGLATFLVATIKEQRWGRTAYDGEVERWRTRSAEVTANKRDAPVALSRPGDVTRKAPLEAELQSRGVTYSRGALVLAKLRSELGDEVFWRGMRRYVSDRAGASARTEHLRAAFETASARDLRPFFERWVYSPAPDL